MAEKVVVYWRDIPAQVIVKAGRKTAKRQLPERFEQAIDRAAMRAEAHRHRRLSRAVAPRRPGALRRRPRGRGRRPRPRRWRPSTRPSACASWSPTAAAPALMYAVRLWSVRHARLLGSASTGASSGPWSPPAPLLRAVGFERLEAPGGRGRAQREGPPVRLPDVRAVRAELDRHVLPDELPQADAQRPVRRGPRRTGIARSSPRCAASGSQAWEGSRRMAEGDRIAELQPPVDHRLAGPLGLAQGACASGVG